MSKQALGYLLGELERLGYLERRPDPDDLRSKRVSLTPRGTAAISVIRDAVGEIETTWAQQLGPKRFDQLRKLLLDLSQPAAGSL
jgi:DNA-binding MarR family transcriptional regulator